MINQNIKHYEIDSKEELPYTHTKKNIQAFQNHISLEEQKKKENAKKLCISK